MIFKGQRKKSGKVAAIVPSALMLPASLAGATTATSTEIGELLGGGFGEMVKAELGSETEVSTEREAVELQDDDFLIRKRYNLIAEAGNEVGGTVENETNELLIGFICEGSDKIECAV